MYSYKTCHFLIQTIHFLQKHPSPSSSSKNIFLSLWIFQLYWHSYTNYNSKFFRQRYCKRKVQCLKHIFLWKTLKQYHWPNLKIFNAIYVSFIIQITHICFQSLINFLAIYEKKELFPYWGHLLSYKNGIKFVQKIFFIFLLAFKGNR